jgi:ubiquinone/menaquinone biosynthesis C-methylase UbiE
MSRPICDYADTDYRQEFWQNKQDRSYENKVEQQLLASLLPKKDGTLLDIGAGFGRLTATYRHHFEQVVLLDYAQNLLDSARKTYGQDQGVQLVKADCYQMPLAANSIDWAVSFRLMHHIAEPEAFLKEVWRVLKPGGTFILEYANKRHMLEILKKIIGKSPKDPFKLAPYQYPGAIYFNFHPKYMKMQTRSAGFKIIKKISISNVRWPVFKRLLKPSLLTVFDRLVRPFFSFFALGPSIILVLKKPAQ